MYINISTKETQYLYTMYKYYKIIFITMYK